jgi:hypothetical protein
MLSALAARGFPVLLQKNGAPLIVLKQNIFWTL